MSEVANVSSYLPQVAAGDSLPTSTGKRRRPPAMLALCLGHINKHHLQSVLHLECGDGVYTKLLAAAGIKRVVGMSTNGAQAAAAAKGIPEAVAARGALQFLCGSLNEVGSENQFDLILAPCLFQGTRNPLATLARARAVAAHSVMGIFAKDSWYSTAQRASDDLLRRRVTYCYKPNELELLGNMAGFARIEIEELGFWGHQYLVTFYKSHHRNSRLGNG